MNTLTHKIIIDGIVYDNRTLEIAKEEKIKYLKEQTSQQILETEGIDGIAQTNAALGIYDTQKTQEIKDKINYWRNRYLQAKENVLNATTNDVVDNVIL
jgi:hypothetical protein